MCIRGRAGCLQGVCDVVQGRGGGGWGQVPGYGLLPRLPAAYEPLSQANGEPTFGIFCGKMLQGYRILPWGRLVCVPGALGLKSRRTRSVSIIVGMSVGISKSKFRQSSQ